MSYSETWAPLAARIRGLTEAGKLHAQYLSVRSSDSYGRAKRLRAQAGLLLDALKAFHDRYQRALPPDATKALKDFIDSTETLIRSDEGTTDSKQEQAWAALVMLSAFETEMSFLLSDGQERVRSRTERALVHLQRLIVVDPAVRDRWQSAFKEGEVACEKLGAVQLLHHGIWAFKVSAAGERTDLVYQQPSGDLLDEQRFADGFVLTEWKLATPANANDQFGAGRAQAKRYAAGALAGAELTGWRYVIAVSKKHVPLPADVQQDGIVYRHVNVAVDPDVPSRAARG